jgi:osmotically inducible protein OsmC
MSASARLLHTARVRAIGGRDRGSARSSDGRLDIKLSAPGGPGTGTNPEQLLAAAWAASFANAISLAARRRDIVLTELTVDAEVDLHLADDGDHFFLRVRLTVTLSTLDRALAKTLVDAAHHVCPYSRAIRGNIDVTTTLT